MRSNSAALVAGPVCLYAAVLVVPMLSCLATGAAAGEGSIGVAGCQTSCGGVDIPFPFGMGRDHCSLPGFEISCKDTGNGVLKPFMATYNRVTRAREVTVEVLSISLEQGEAKVLNNISSNCYDAASGKMVQNVEYSFDVGAGSWSFSSTANKFTVVGCRALVYISDITSTAVDNFKTGCVSACYDRKMSLNPCSGMGCCQATIPKGHQFYFVKFDDGFMNMSEMENGVDLYGRCSFAVLMDSSNFPSSTSSSNNHFSPELNNITSTLEFFNSSRGGKAPVVIDWFIGKDNCTTAFRNPAGYACRSINSNCSDSDSGLGYICKCKQGFHGNPYLPNGCQDIDECLDREKYPCNGVCTNTNGSFTCECPKGTQGNASAECRKDPFPFRARVATGICAGLLVALIAFLSTEVVLNKENRKIQRYFEQHGGRMLSRILETEGNRTFKLYERGDLVKATHGFHKSNIVGEGAHGTVYKATFGTATVAVKRCKQIEKTRTEEFVQELVVLCRVNHPNIVRLLGCCFHFEAPMLVYEVVPNGTLGDLLYGDKSRRRVTLPTRLRIAAETAEALVYLHKPPHPTLHGDVKPQNILLGERWVAKVSDFGCSTINDNVQVMPKGTLAYLDPEFLQDFQITEKTDVYSFGIVLIEILTGKNPQTKEWKNLTVMFQDSMGNDTLGGLLDPDIVEEASMGLIYEAAKLVIRCIAAPGKARPDMGQVAEELRRFSDQMPESPEAHVALEVEVDRDSCTASTEGGTTGSYSNFAALSTELAR